MVKVLHCADIHLDSPFSSGKAESSAEARRRLRLVFMSMIEYIKNEGISLALLAGDVFDSTCVTSDTASFIKEAFASAPLCSFVISPGNHDPYSEKSIYALGEFSENVHIFKENSLSFFDFPQYNIRVYGYAFTSPSLTECPFADKRPEDETKINLLCAHGDVGVPLSVYCPISEYDIENSGFDYCAFGHVHLGSGIKTAGNVPYAYSGCLSGRDFGETGEKGAVIINISDDKKLSFENKVFSFYSYMWNKLDITGIGDSTELRERIRNCVKEYTDKTLLRIELTGQVPMGLNIDTEGLSQTLADNVFYLEIKDSTTLQYDTASLENDPTIIGELYRSIKPLLESGSTEERKTAHLALRMGINALKGEELPQ